MTVPLHEQILSLGLEAYEDAARRIAPHCLETPLLPLGEAGLHLAKAECLQPTGSFKIRGATNAVAQVEAPDGFVTASAGNFAQGLALACRRRGMPLWVHAPDTASEAKLAALARLGAQVELHGFDIWWQMLETRRAPGPGHFLHPVAEPGVIVGNGTIALELIRSGIPFDTVVVPVGGGGLISGIAACFRAAGHKIRLVGCEIESSTPLTLALAAGRPVPADRGPSWVDGIGGRGVLDAMWPLLHTLVDQTVVISHAQARRALVELLSGNRLLVEGAGAVAVAGALAAPPAWGRTVAIACGGNIALSLVAQLMAEDEA
jgi:threonine dehydratase